MIKKFSVTLCLLTMCTIILTGCHGSKGLPAFEVPENFDTSRNYEITFWAKNDTNKTQTDIYKKAITDFEALYPNISVKMKLYTDYGRIYNDVITNIATIPNGNFVKFNIFNCFNLASNDVFDFFNHQEACCKLRFII